MLDAEVISLFGCYDEVVQEQQPPSTSSSQGNGNCGANISSKESNMETFLGLFDPSFEDESPSTGEKGCVSPDGFIGCHKSSKGKKNKKKKSLEINNCEHSAYAVLKKNSSGFSSKSVTQVDCGQPAENEQHLLNNYQCNEDATRRRPRATMNMLDKYNDWAAEKQAKQLPNLNKNNNILNSINAKNTNVTQRKKKNQASICCKFTNTKVMKTTLNCPNSFISTEESIGDGNIKYNLYKSSPYTSLTKNISIDYLNENVTSGSLRKLSLDGLPEDKELTKKYNSLRIFLDDKDTDDEVIEDMVLPDQLPSEPQEGNIEYKLKLLNPNHERFKRLVSQMQWRLREGLGEAIYEIGVEDSGLLLGLSEEELNMSMTTLRRMARQLGASLTVIREKNIGEDGKKVAEVLVRKVPDDQYSIELRIAVLGSSDVGKSTLLGVLTRGELDNGRGCARLNVFRHRHEVYSGKTSSISIQTMGFDSHGNVVDGTCTRSRDYDDEDICSQSSKIVNFIDLAGDQRYLHTTAFGLSGYCPHYAMLVVNAFSGLSAMSEEHLSLARAVDLPLLLVVTKTDLATPVQLNSTIGTLRSVLTAPPYMKMPLIISTADDAITAGSKCCHDSAVVPIFLVSSVTGEGLHLLKKFLFVLPPKMSAKEREKSEQEVAQFQIDEVFHVDERVIVGGLLTAGVIPQGVSLMLGPSDDCCFAKVSVESIHRNKVPCRVVCAGQSASLSLTDNESFPIRKGMKLLSPETKPNAAYYFQARIKVVSGAVGIGRGSQLTAHIGNVRQTVVVEGVLGKKRMRASDDKPSSVMLRFLRQPEYVSVGARLLLRQGNVAGVGQLQQVFGEPPNTYLKVNR